MRMYDIIHKKRDGEALTEAEIRNFVEGYTSGDIPDYQAAALCMAIYFRGMNDKETLALTLAIRDSGDILHFPNIHGLRVDKHSTGGVGDKTSLVIAPIVASLGLKIAKMSGRGLGHTGGTVDKLESFAGLKTDFSTEEFESIVNRTGIAIVGQSAELAPADKKLYALRDVTATVDSIPLIASSIMGKKLAANDDCIVLDVKTGSGSFMKTKEDSIRLAKTMVSIGKGAGKKVRALITDMDVPLGNAIGNSIEVIEAIETLRGEGPEDLTHLCTALASHMLSLAGYGTRTECEALAENAISTGKALKKLAEMVKAQGGNPEWVYNTQLFPVAAHSRTVSAPRDGYIHHVDTEGYGMASLILGAGRSKKGDEIDHTAGIHLSKKTGDPVKAGEIVATLYSNRAETLSEAARKLLDSTFITDDKPEIDPLILDIVE
ncbi:MAG: thymidine phosphorylase [Ruminococcus sp.]|nr:thymidine phosphorylase [Ruminococcus sp.]MDD7670928.1 thymidine phosphorylase [Ruminococcus sp.]MDY2743588.1 thymidine phosphorylase [Eubacteriales bacterium]